MALAETAILSLQGVTKTYGSRLALDNISLSIGTGITGLLGPNGSGKSTLIKSLLGLLSLQAGTAEVLGHRLPGSVRAIRDHVGYVPEDDCFIAGLTGIESVNFLARLAGLPATESLRRSHEVLDFADISQERYRKVETYSTGMRQKLKFAQAIVHDPQLLILDEPTSGLDPQQRTSLLAKIRTLATQHDKSVVICTHILNDVKAVCDSVVIMARGQVRLVDSLSNLMRPVRSGVQVWLNAPTEDRTTAFLQQLEQAGIPAQPSPDHHSVWCHDITPTDTQRVWQSAVSAGVSIARLTAAKNSLDEIFLNAVKEAEHAAA